MSKINELFQQPMKVVNIGTSKFKQDLDLQKVEAVQVNWNPPAGGNSELIEALDFFTDNEKIDEANKEAIKRMKDAHPFLIDIDLAINVIPGMHRKKILHSGPPTKWENMCGPQQGAIIGALIYEGLASNEEEAIKLAESGEI